MPASLEAAGQNPFRNYTVTVDGGGVRTRARRDDERLRDHLRRDH
jgi:hypothetical protein